MQVHTLLVTLAPLALGQVSLEPKVAVPEGWTIVGPSARNQMLELTFAVKQRNLQLLHDTLMQVSTPSSQKYGMHLTNEEVQAMTAPEEANIEALFAYLQTFGVQGMKQTPNGDMIAASVTVEVAEKLLSAKYMELQHTKTGVIVHRSPEGYALPAEIAASIDFVSPTVHVPGVNEPTKIEASKLGSSLPSLNTPKSMRTLYSVGNTVGKAANNKQAVTAFLRQFYNKNALHSFWNQYCNSTDFTCGKGDPKLVGDGTTGLMPGTESMLDIEQITSMGGNIESEFWGFKGNSPDNKANEPFMKWLAQVSSTADADVPKVFSTSYGEDESSWSYAAAQRLNVEFMKAGTRGISLLFASGDSGANCKGTKFSPNEPASSPYVTSVGGTMPGLLYPKPGAERAIGLSSGGFSNYWPMPDYQKDAVSQYLQQSGLPPSSAYNASGRAFPDIAAQATLFPVTLTGGMTTIVSGTSCASPTAAGIISLLNDVRLQNGKSTLGFLNPFLYTSASDFNDITSGASTGCLGSIKGWPATKGWDAVTGIGTLNYEKLLQAVQALPAGKSTNEMASIVV
eukprot:gnl/MRDRNA2_/MRDRNA2_32444_c0_seq1.p1 gnl/MRDRNA2_/MRDRNA2_32444_c0~~gnl/MRDRNA2_/MRDRNA2_32444_c0_seq1.p1  ORF type:complete len:568 (-),score=126.00 gnl/MRDRNA2_/MRDRNA2_32444_c0_seq1:65-1768(-)